MLSINLNGTHSANVFLIRALEKIIGDKEMKKSSNNQLRKQCESALSNGIFLYNKFYFHVISEV